MKFFYLFERFRNDCLLRRAVENDQWSPGDEATLSWSLELKSLVICDTVQEFVHCNIDTSTKIYALD